MSEIRKSDNPVPGIVTMCVNFGIMCHFYMYIYRTAQDFDSWRQLSFSCHENEAFFIYSVFTFNETIVIP